MPLSTEAGRLHSSGCEQAISSAINRTSGLSHIHVNRSQLTESLCARSQFRITHISQAVQLSESAVDPLNGIIKHHHRDVQSEQRRDLVRSTHTEGKNFRYRPRDSLGNCRKLSTIPHRYDGEHFTLAAFLIGQTHRCCYSEVRISSAEIPL